MNKEVFLYIHDFLGFTIEILRNIRKENYKNIEIINSKQKTVFVFLCPDGLKKLQKSCNMITISNRNVKTYFKLYFLEFYYKSYNMISYCRATLTRSN